MDLFPEALLDGYRTFRAQRLPTEQSRYRDLSVRGQAPTTMIICCCDSRAAPETIFDAGPGELFVLRNIANLVPTFQPDAGRTAPRPVSNMPSTRSGSPIWLCSAMAAAAASAGLEPNR